LSGRHQQTIYGDRIAISGTSPTVIGLSNTTNGYLLANVQFFHNNNKKNKVLTFKLTMKVPK